MDPDESERGVLQRYLTKNRDAVVGACAGLSEQQLRRPGVASGTNLIGLIQHLTGVEQHWLGRVFLGEAIEPDESMLVGPARTAEQVIAAYRSACARSDEIVRACPDLATRAAAPNPGEAHLCSLRRILAHLIEETARHAGHADILREQIDGVTAD